MCTSLTGRSPARSPESRTEESATDYLTYCTNCRDFFAEKGKASYHVLDLIFDGYAAGAAARPGPTLSERRANRRESAGRLLTELWGEPMPEPEDHIALKVRMAPEVAAKMERDFILLDDVQGGHPLGGDDRQQSRDCPRRDGSSPICART